MFLRILFDDSIVNCELALPFIFEFASSYPTGTLVPDLSLVSSASTSTILPTMLFDDLVQVNSAAIFD